MKKFAAFKTAVSLPLAVAATATMIFINETSFQQSTEAIATMEKAQQTRTVITGLVREVLDAETGQRGYLLTGDPRYLEPYQIAVGNIANHLNLLRQTFAHKPELIGEFDLLTRHVSRKMSEMDLSVRMRKEGNDDGWKFVLTSDVGKEEMAAIRNQSDKLSAENIQQTEQALAQVQKALQSSRFRIAATAVIGLLAFYMYLSQNRALLESGQQEQDSLQHERNLLETQVRERTSSLAELASHLQNVREDERSHLARELHDELGALLTAAKLDVARLKSRLTDNLPEALDRLEHLTTTLNTGIALKRRIIEDLRPSSLTHLGLVASLEILAREFKERSGLSVVIDLETVELGGSAQLTVYRLVQESLTNIAKYADASEVEISLHNFNDVITVDVKDNGKGFKTENIDSASHGLAGMRHRVEAAGGKFTVASIQESGTHVGALLPKS